MESRKFIVKFRQIMGTLQVAPFVLWIFGCGSLPRSHETALPPVSASAPSVSPGSTVEIKRTPGDFMLSDTSPVYEHPDKTSAIIEYAPKGALGRQSRLHPQRRSKAKIAAVVPGLSE